MQLGKIFINSDPANLKFVIIQTGICVTSTALIVQVQGKQDQEDEEELWKILRIFMGADFFSKCISVHFPTEPLVGQVLPGHFDEFPKDIH